MKKRKFIKCAAINARSVENKMSELQIKADAKKLGIISVTETWGQKGKSYNLKGYNQYRNDREDGHGGTILYVKHGIEQRVCKPLNTQGFDNSAWCWIVEKGGKKLL